MLRNHIAFFGLVFVIFILSTASGCKKQPTAPQMTPPDVTVAVPIEKKVKPYFDFTGNLRATKSVDVRARVEGFLEEIHFEDGDYVEQGQILFTIEPEQFEANVAQATAYLEAAKADLKRTEADVKRVEKAVQTAAVSQQEVDLRRAERDVAAAAVQKAEAALKEARLQLSYTEVVSPIAGRTSRRKVDSGNVVGAGERTLLTRVNQIEPIYVYFNFSERLILRFIRLAEEYGHKKSENEIPHIPISIQLQDEQTFSHSGKIDFIDNQIESGTGTIEVRGVLTNKQKLLVPGMFVRIRVYSLEDRPALLVQEQAIGTDLGGKYLLVVTDTKEGNNLVQRRYVTLGQLYDNQRAIVANEKGEVGIQPGEKYIITGLQRARPGMPVNPKFADAKPEIQREESK